MRTMATAAVALTLMVPGAAAQQQSGQQAAQRRELERKMQQLEQQMQGLEQELARMAPEEAQLRAATGPMLRLFDQHARLGVIVQADKDLATDSIGAKITGVTPGGPAEQAGLKAGDIITTFNSEKLAGGYPAAGADESAPGIKLRDLASDLSDGDTVKVDYRRGREIRHATIVARALLGESLGYAFATQLPRVNVESGEIADVVQAQRRAAEARAEAFRSAMPAMVGPWMYDRWFDMDLVALNPELGSYFGTNTGLLVVHPPDDSTLDLKSGDVILSVDGRTPTSQPQLVRILRSYGPGETIHLDVMRHQHRMTVTATIPGHDGSRDGMDLDWHHRGIMR